MKFTETNTWCTSHNGETFYDADYDSREEAIRACKEEAAGIYVGKAVKVEFDENDFCEDIADSYADKLYDEVGDVAETWGLSAEDEAKLNKLIGKVIANYLTEHNLQPDCFKVTNIEEVNI